MLSRGCLAEMQSNSKKPTLWVLTSTFPRWAGDVVPAFVAELSKRLAAGFRVVVLAPHAPGAALRETLDDMEVHRYRYAPVRLERLAYEGGILASLRRRPWTLLLVPLLVIGLWRALRRLRHLAPPDVVHAHWMFPQGWVAAVALPGKVALVTTSHGSDLYRLRGWAWNAMRRVVVSRSCRVTVVSEAMRQRLQRDELPTTQVEVLPMGLDLIDRFTPAAVRREEGEILFVGRLIPIKGCRQLIEAFALLKARGLAHRLRVVGDGPERTALHAHARQLGVQDSVEFAGAVRNEELSAWYRRASLLVAPYVEQGGDAAEGLGMVPLEAIGCHCPVVATPGAQVNTLIRDGETAWLAPSTAPADLAATIAMALAEPAERLRRSAVARSESLSRFDWRVIAQRYAELLMACVEHNKDL